MVDALGTDRADLVNLERASGSSGIALRGMERLVFEAHSDLADLFRLEAARFWCDAAPVLRRGYEAVLADLTQ